MYEKGEERWKGGAAGEERRRTVSHIFKRLSRVTVANSSPVSLYAVNPGMFEFSSYTQTSSIF